MSNIRERLKEQQNLEICIWKMMNLQMPKGITKKYYPCHTCTGEYPTCECYTPLSRVIGQDYQEGKQWVLQ